MRPVYITRLSKFLPNEPVSNDEMEQVLGFINGKPSKARAIVLRSNGIKTRYYAFRDGKSTHSNAELAANAIRGLFDESLPISKLEVITTGCTTQDQLLPSQAAMVHGELGIQPVELLSATGACCSSVQAMKYAYMSVGAGLADCAASVGSEKVSTWMHSSRFESETENLKKLEDNPYIAFEKDFLRWMLSDGAGAALLQNTANDNGISLRIDWLETSSYASELEPCMYAGATKNEDKTLTGWSDHAVEDWTKTGVFALKQDTKLLSNYVVRKGAEFLQKLIDKHSLTSDNVDYFLPHMSSEFFKGQVYEYLKSVGLDLPEEKWFYNLPKVGNVGSASTFLMLEELFYSGRLNKGDRILVMVPESSRFSYAYIYLTVV